MSRVKGCSNARRKTPEWFFENFLKPIIPKNVSLVGTEPVTIEVSWVKPGENV